MQTSSVLFLPFVIVITLPTARADEVRVEFGSVPLDRWLFRTEAGESGGCWQATNEGLRAVLPAGALGRSPLKIRAQVHLQGDCEIVAQYAITSLPHPTTNTGRNNVQIAISGSDGFATCFRNNEAGPRGDGHGYYVGYTDQRPSVFRHFPNKATAGQLGIKRIGKTLYFSQGEIGESLVELGHVEFGRRPIADVNLEALASHTTDGLDVRFDRVAIRADKIVRLHEPPGRGWNWWFWGPIVGAAAIIVLWAGRKWAASR